MLVRRSIHQVRFEFEGTVRLRVRVRVRVTVRLSVRVTVRGDVIN